MEKIHALDAIKAFGGPIAAAVKDPALDIRHMLIQIAAAAAPAGTEVSVTVDRFTEFDAALVLHRPLSFRQMAGITKVFLKNGTPYVHNLRFIQGNEVLAQLQEGDIESVTNWETASIESIQGLLLTSNTESTPGPAASESSATQTSNEELSPDQKKMAEAQSMFKEDFDEHVRLLQKVVADLGQAAQLGAVRNRNQLNAQIASQDQMASRLAAERDFFLHQSVDMEAILKVQNLDPLLTTILKRETQNRNQDEAAILSRLFDSLSAYQDQIKSFLKIMESHWGEWSEEPGSRQIRFTTSDAQNAYSLGTIPVESSAREVQDSFRSWANHKPAK